MTFSVWKITVSKAVNCNQFPRKRCTIPVCNVFYLFSYPRCKIPHWLKQIDEVNNFHLSNRSKKVGRNRGLDLALPLWVHELVPAPWQHETWSPGDSAFVSFVNRMCIALSIMQMIGETQFKNTVHWYIAIKWKCLRLRTFNRQCAGAWQW